MISVPAGARIVVATEPVDGRKGMDSLAAVVQQALRSNPFSGNIFIFRTKRAEPDKARRVGRHRFMPVHEAP